MMESTLGMTLAGSYSDVEVAVRLNDSPSERLGVQRRRWALRFPSRKADWSLPGLENARDTRFPGPSSSCLPF